MTNHHLSSSSFQNLFLFVLFFFLVAPPPSSLLVRGECEFCFQGSEVEDLETATPIMGSNKIMNCVDLKASFEANGGPESSGLTCTEWQLEGYQSGCCDDVNVESGCSLCPGGEDFQIGNQVPTDGAAGLNPVDCEGWPFWPRSHNGLFYPGKCSDTRMQRSAFYCGCTSSRQETWLCSDTQQKPNNPKRGDFYRREKCGETEFTYSLIKNGELSKEPKLEFGFDAEAWCECPGVTLQNDFECTFCKDGIKKDHGDLIFNENDDFIYKPGEYNYRRTCNQVEDYARYITTQASCDERLEKARLFCCPAAGLKTIFSVVITGVMVLYGMFA